MAELQAEALRVAEVGGVSVVVWEGEKVALEDTLKEGRGEPE